MKIYKDVHEWLDEIEHGDHGVTSKAERIPLGALGYILLAWDLGGATAKEDLKRIKRENEHLKDRVAELESLIRKQVY